MDNYTGKRLDGRYEIQEVIGVGGMAVVYKAYDNIDDRIVAVKILKDEFLANEEFRRRFKNESKAIAVLSHPNIVKVYDVSYGDRLQYIVMEYVEGITLKEYIEQQKQISWREAIHFTTQILRALQHAHDKGIVHRDVKPQNTMLLQNGNIKVADFGIARFSRSDTHTMTDSAIGSVHYISPEQARGDITDDKADIYSVGVVLYEMLTGQLPFQSANSVSVAIMQLQSDPTLPRQINPNIPAGLEQITMRAMQKNAKDRYQSAAEMLLDLEEVKRNPNIQFDYSYFVDNTPTKFVSRKIEVPAAAQQPEPAVEALAAEDGKTKNVSILVGVTIGLVVIVGIILAIYFIVGNPNSGDRVTVPNLVGKTLEAVQEEYGDTFEFDITYVQNSAYENGVIFKQDPGQGKKLKKGDTIIVQVASESGADPAAEKVAVPEVAGQQIARGESAMTNRGLKPQAVAQPDATLAEGTIISTDPAEGTQVPVGSVVLIYYASSSGLKTVPDLLGYDQETADLMLTGEGLKLGTVSKRDSDEKAGIVIEQSYAKDTKVAPGTAVNIVVSSGISPSSSITLSVKLPNRSGGSGSTGKITVYKNNNEYETKNNVLFDGSTYDVTIEGTGKSNSIKIYADSDLIYQCTVDFTVNPATASNIVIPTTSSPGQTAVVPNVVGKSESAAVQDLNDAGFTNIKKNYVPCSAYQNGTVISQNPINSIIRKPLDTEIVLDIGDSSL